MKFLLSALLLMPLGVVAQDETDQAPAAPPKPCASEKHRQFDFWVGDWDVSQGGKPAGHNHIELLHGGCVLAENWTSAAGNFTGRSVNIYDQAKDRWHQSWVDSSGTLLLLDGGLQEGSMVLGGTRPGQDGAEVMHRITFTPNEDGSVRQHWETSLDGAAWTTAFDGHYVKSGAAE